MSPRLAPIRPEAERERVKKWKRNGDLIWLQNCYKMLMVNEKNV